MSSFKDYIGSRDVKWWDGIARTFSRLTSTGGTLTNNKLGHMVDVLAVYGSHDTYTGATIQTAVTSVGSNTCIFLLTPGTWTISANLTIPANVTLYVPHGVTISVATGITLTINGPIMAGSYQIFDGAGTIGGTPILLWRDATWFSGTITDSTTPTYKASKGGAVTAATSVTTDTISEFTAAAGVTIDGVKLKDSQPYCDVINEKTTATGVTIDGVKLKDNEPYCDVINERTSDAGVTGDGVLLKDNAVTASGGIKTDGSNLLITKIYNIGDWNMNTTESVSIPHGLTLSQIRFISAQIITDSGLSIHDLVTHVATGTGTVTGYTTADTTNLILGRTTGGFFDAVGYQTTPFNRGYITVIYVP